MHEEPHTPKPNFIRQIVSDDLAAGKHGIVHTRFPPEPNGYLHIGHAKSIVLNFGLAEDFGGLCNLRFDDTNPHKENQEFVAAIKEDVRWLGFGWDDRLYFASDYFSNLFDYALELIDKGLAYVCELNAEDMREYRGTLKEPGRDSPFRDRSPAENRDLFQQMRAGEFPDGSKVLRARIDMASPNINLRDPVLYRIRHGVIHHQTGAEWCLYPMYDFTHPISDAIEGVTHSLCTLEFEDHRPLYDWIVSNLSVPTQPRQIEFSRLNLEYTVTSKRKLTELVSEGHVNGWDDPRMPTLSGLRRRGYTPAAIRDFCQRIGITKSENRIEMQLLEDCIRDDLNRHAPRRLAVINPIKVVLSNYDDNACEYLPAPNHPQDPSLGERRLPFCRELWIDRADFQETANKKYKRLVSGGLVRLRNGYVIRCDEVIKDAGGEIQELHCHWYPDTLENNPDGEKVRGVIHWVSARHGEPAEIRLYDRLFNIANPGKKSGDYRSDINPDSLLTCVNAVVEPCLAAATPEQRFQFEREGYFCRDSSSEKLVFNRTVTLRDTWARNTSEET
ncbi:MAG: glutamine--tRNA ligase/YqeY domain fusion protein [Gammaproteobacteria bacterium]|nr:glutamine--tRNA ligase/YqeY domain fusion protein [Gammaproteobacteria bacterium]MCP5135643.1 glutamine--tRNA ligase/YqeY domain fusion protein [Gammaproteobacteria bacterium]